MFISIKYILLTNDANGQMDGWTESKVNSVYPLPKLRLRGCKYMYMSNNKRVSFLFSWKGPLYNEMADIKVINLKYN
jgi:hypothetical protein